MAGAPIRVLVVDDSAVARELLVHILSEAPGIEVVGTAGDGGRAVELAGKLKPDVITMDVNMPVMDGIEATRSIMERHPAPIVIVSGVWDPKEAATTFRAVEAGALSVVRRPVATGPEAERMKAELASAVRLMSEVKVVRRWARPAPPREARPETTEAAARPDVEVIAIGASTGGPMAIRTILSALPAGFPIPLLAVQHIAAGFIGWMVEWLSGSTALDVRVAKEGEEIRGGRCYFAPDGADMGTDGRGRIRLAGTGRRAPSVSYLFRSVAESYGGRCAGVLLSGMGDDGAAELKAMRGKGGLTVCQDRESSVVFGMPGEAVRIDAAEHVLSPERIGTLLAGLPTKGP